MRALLPLLALLLAVVPAAWVSRIRDDGAVVMRPVPLGRADRQVGGLRYLGGWVLTARDRRFGGFSALAADGAGLVLLSDTGWTLRLDGGHWRNVAAGGDKAARDSESIARDPSTGRWWIGFEGQNLITRRGPDLARAEAAVRPAAMRRWPDNGGPESLARLPDGRFVVIAETAKRPDGARQGLLFPGDPTGGAAPVRFGYRPPAGMDPSDAAALPDGRLLVLNRRLGWRGFDAVLSVVELGRAGSGGVVAGREVARLAPPLPVDNMEGVAVTQERGRTVVWLVSDDNFLPFQRTLLMKFALGGGAAESH